MNKTPSLGLGLTIIPRLQGIATGKSIASPGHARPAGPPPEASIPHPVHVPPVGNGTPCRAQTCDLRLRRPTLYSTELRGRPLHPHTRKIGYHPVAHPASASSQPPGHRDAPDRPTGPGLASPGIAPRFDAVDPVDTARGIATIRASREERVPRTTRFMEDLR
jgi:hypothetical protein